MLSALVVSVLTQLDGGVAATVVARAARVQPGELVLVTGGVQDRALLEQLALAVHQAGAHAVLQVESEALERSLLADVPAANDANVSAGAAKLWRSVDTVLTVPHVEHPDYLAGVPAERRAQRSAALLKLEELANQRGVKRVELGNGIYPTEANAKRLGMPRAELSAAFFAAVAVDPADLAQRGAKLAKALQAGKVLRITHKNGTDLTVRLAGKTPKVADGRIPADAKGADTLLWLPAGEVYVTPAPGTAEGKVVVPRAFYAGSEITGLTLTFKAGRLTAMTAAKGLETLKAAYDLEKDPRKGDFAFVDLGLNPKLDAARVLTFNAGGMVTVGFGNNLWAGGNNNVPFDVGGCYLPGAVVTVDGQELPERR